MAVDFGNYTSFYPGIKYYYNSLNNLIFVSNLFKQKQCLSAQFNENKVDVKSKE